MKLITLITVALLISANLNAKDLILKNSKRFTGEYALIFMWDTGGLNNLNSSPLALKNIEKYKQLVTKSTLRKMKISKIAHYSFNEQVTLIGQAESSRTGKLFRESKKVMEDVIVKLEEDNSKKAKDVINTFSFVNNVVEQSYSGFTKVSIVVFSNLRDSMSTKEERKKMKPIKLNDKIVLHLFSSSGLDSKGASTNQLLQAENSIVKFYKEKLISSNPITIKTVY